MHVHFDVSGSLGKHSHRSRGLGKILTIIEILRLPRKRVGGTELVQPSWFHGRICCEVRKRKRFYHAAKSNPTPENERRLYNQRRVVKKMVRQAKSAEEHRVALACHDNPKEFFVYVNKHKPRAPLGPVFSADGHLLTNDEEMASVKRAQQHTPYKNNKNTES